MTRRTHNDFLDLDESEEDGSQGYNSEIEALQKGSRTTKRQKVDSEASDADSSQGYNSEIEDLQKGKRTAKRRKINGSDSKEDVDESVDQDNDAREVGGIQLKSESTRKSITSELAGVSKPLTKKNLVATAKAVKRSGVVYLSRVPPFMKPSKLRALLLPYGAINRIFLTPEDPTSHTRRVRNGGNKKRSFSDGWVEFINKKDAKQACELLNAKTIGGKKGNYYHDDVWNLFYLKNFKWNNLTEQIAAENAERASRMRAEISKTTKENKEFVQNVERAKIEETRRHKATAKGAKERDTHEASSTTAEGTATEPKRSGERPRYFKQTAVASKRRPEDQPEQVKRVLSKIF
jgi:ESF2/ABP1 family protein